MQTRTASLLTGQKVTRQKLWQTLDIVIGAYIPELQIVRQMMKSQRASRGTATSQEAGVVAVRGGDSPTTRFAWFTFGLLCLTAFIERGVEQALPALFPYLAGGLGMSPLQLAALPFMRGMFQAIFAILGGWAAQEFHRGWVCGLGCLLYGACTMWVGLMDAKFWFMGYPLMVFTALGLSLIIPGSYSLIKNLLTEAEAADRDGLAFGVQYCFGAMGCGVVSLLAFMLGYTPGWRVVLIFIGLVTILMGVLDISFVHDPRTRNDEESPQDVMQSLKQIWRCKTMRWIIGQGAVGQIPYNCLVFNSLFLDSLPITKFQVSWILFTFWMATGAGGVIGGRVGDWAADEKRSPKYGRVVVAQISLVVSMAVGLTLYKFMPRQKFSSLMVVSGLLGLFSSWVGSACTFPIIGDVIAEEDHSLGFAFDRCCESFIGTCFPLIFAGTLQSLGYVGPENFPSKKQVEDNAEHMGMIMAYIMCACWGACCVILSGLHWQYPKDSITLRLQHEHEEDSSDSENMPPSGKRSLAGDLGRDSHDLLDSSPSFSPTAEPPQIPGSNMSHFLPTLTAPEQ